MQNRHHPLAPHQPFSKTALSLAPHQPFQSRTITIAFRRGASLLLPLHRILPFTQSSQKYNHPLLRTIALASLVKGRWIDGKAHTVALLLSACDMPTTFILQTFLPSRRRDCSAIFHPEQILPKPHYPSLRTTFLPPLSKVRCCRLKISGEYWRDCSAIFHPEPTLPKPHYPSLRTTFFHPLSKVRCCPTNSTIGSL